MQEIIQVNVEQQTVSIPYWSISSVSQADSLSIKKKIHKYPDYSRLSFLWALFLLPTGCSASDSMLWKKPIDPYVIAHHGQDSDGITTAIVLSGNHPHPPRKILWTSQTPSRHRRSPQRSRMTTLFRTKNNCRLKLNALQKLRGPPLQTGLGVATFICCR